MITDSKPEKAETYVSGEAIKKRDQSLPSNPRRAQKLGELVGSLGKEQCGIYPFPYLDEACSS